MSLNFTKQVLMLLVLLYSFSVAAKPTVQEVEAFIQQYDQNNRTETRTPGWAFSYVQDSALLTQTFGKSDVDSGEVVTEDTVFRIASVSKIFVGIAVQQLLERGEVDLNTNVVHYLPDLQVIKALKWPVTLHHLMSHTAGFEDKFYGDSVRTEQEVQSLEVHLSQALPKQIYQPGELLAYSNYGYSLAALVVEKVSGMPFYEYVQRHILQPVGMKNSSFVLTPELQEKLATGYEYENGHYQPQPYTWVHRYPATSMLTTAADMAKLIVALTGSRDGQIGQLLSEQSLQQMFSTLFTHHPELPGMALGWMEFQRYGNKMYYHDGGTPGFVAQLVIIPDKNVGYFIAANQKGSSLPGSLRFDLLKAFHFEELDHKRVQVEPLLPLSSYAGNYQNNRKNITSFEAFAQLMSREALVDVSDDGRSLHYWDRTYKPYADNRFIHEASGHILVFATDGDKVTHLFQDWGGAPRSFTKLQRWQTRECRFVTFSVILVLNLLMVIWAWFNRKKVKGRDYAAFANGIMLFFFVALSLYTWQLQSVYIRLAEIVVLKALLALPLCAILCVLLAVFARNESKLRKLTILPVLMGVAWLAQFNMLGWHFY